MPAFGEVLAPGVEEIFVGKARVRFLISTATQKAWVLAEKVKIEAAEAEIDRIAAGGAPAPVVEPAPEPVQVPVAAVEEAEAAVIETSTVPVETVAEPESEPIRRRKPR